jgi:hypothetical protein
MRSRGLFIFQKFLHLNYIQYVYDTDRKDTKKDLEIWAIHTKIHNLKFQNYFFISLLVNQKTVQMDSKLNLAFV